jgi:hypothetical protein
MQASIPQPQPSQPRHRAIVEIRGAELKIFPIAQSDAEAARIMDALRFLREYFEAR